MSETTASIASTESVKHVTVKEFAESHNIRNSNGKLNMVQATSVLKFLVNRGIAKISGKVHHPKNAEGKGVQGNCALIFEIPLNANISICSDVASDTLVKQVTMKQFAEMNDIRDSNSKLNTVQATSVLNFLVNSGSVKITGKKDRPRNEYGKCVAGRREYIFEIPQNVNMSL